MDYHKINELLEKYYEGETTLDEETYIKEYFANTDLSKEHLSQKQMFQYFNTEKQNNKPQFDVNTELTSLMEKQWQTETKIRFNRTLKWVSSVAALFILSISIYNYYDKPAFVLKDTYSDSEQAYNETKRVLIYVSDCMTQKTDNLKYLSEIDESFNKLNEVLEINGINNNKK